MSGLWWLILGILVGWLVELAVDYRFWRREAKATAAFSSAGAPGRRGARLAT